MKTWFARLLPPRPTFALDMTDAEKKAMGEHGMYWRGMLDRGLVHTFGLVMDPRGAFGVGILELPDDVDPKPLTDADPVIRANLGLRYEIFPMPMGAVHK